MSKVLEFPHKRNRGFGRRALSCEVNSMGERALVLANRPDADVPEDVLSEPQALAALAALGQPTRLDIFRLLIRRGPDGLLAGRIAEAVGCPHNTVSSHLSVLAHAGLIRGTREGRTILYRATLETMRALLAFLATDCCNGHPELCDLATAIHGAACGCPSIAKNHGATKHAKR